MRSSRIFNPGNASVGSNHIVLSMATAMVTYLTLAALDARIIDDVSAYICFTLIILGFSFVQAVLSYEEDGRWVIANPAVAATLIASFLQLGIGNLIWFAPDDILYLTPALLVIDYWSDYYLALLILAFIALWSGYRSPWGREMEGASRTRNCSAIGCGRLDR